MGKGDKKTKRGKIISGSYGVRRPKKAVKPSVEKIVIEKPKTAPVAETKKPAAKKPAAKKSAAQKGEE